MKQIDLSGVSNILSRILLIEVAGFLSCVPVAFYFDEPAGAFLLSSIIAGLFSLLLFVISNRWDTSRVGVRDAFVSVSLSWITISLFGALPYILSGVIPSVTDSIFESTSGLQLPDHQYLQILRWCQNHCFSGGASPTGLVVSALCCLL
ncbi:MAG: hypothetical protein R2727_11250 [Bacteroidales bacterium]